MDIGLIIYGRLDTLTGGYIYDRILVEHLRRHGHRVEVISLPRDALCPSTAGQLLKEAFVKACIG